jgi:hypothetical protein
MNTLLIILVIAGFLTIVSIQYLLDRKRRDEMSRIAAQLGLTYYPDKSEVYYDLTLFTKGHSQTISNTMSGSKNGCHVAMFDYTYTTGSGKNKRVHQHSVCLLSISQCLKKLLIRPENILDKLAGAIGFDDIDFESMEFSHRFYVKSDDKKFAYAIIHPQMMSFLLSRASPPLIEKNGAHIGCYYTKKIKPAGYLDIYKFADDFYKNIPNYVLKDCTTDIGAS